MPYAVLILAAGQASRMGRCKALLPLTEDAGDHALSRLARLWSGARVRLAVTGFHADAVEAACASLGWGSVRNPRPERGMFSSVRTGLEEIARIAAASAIDGVFLQPVDVPLVRPLTVACLSGAAADFPGRALIPTFAGTEGHPVFLPMGLLPSIFAADEEGGLRAVLSRLPLHHVPVADALMLRDMDTPDDYAALRARAVETDILSVAEAEELLRLRGVPERGSRHARAVGTVARALAVALGRARRGASVPDPVCCHVAGLLHDVCKGEAEHEAAGERLLRGYGLERLAVIVGAHRDMLPVPPEKLTERELVFLADKYCRGGDWVSVAQRFADKLERYAGDQAACAAIEGRRERALRMEAALAEALRPLADRGEAAVPADIARRALADRVAVSEDGRHAAAE
ncbi:DVU_1551 family NTP transferase [uncultured Desulfovibrio sp.]|uniref:DVU_1551 family NTP transferase n=1 Tax=uncultured Desulfovibrio sp. TaxID=167968 RepID=UPI0026135955|nr:NTP transferase domain-containing protein [uncultured Desulfovibrio sp.]